MPTSLPQRATARKSPNLLLIFYLAIMGAAFAIEMIDPAPMDVDAAVFTAL